VDEGVTPLSPSDERLILLRGRRRRRRARFSSSDDLAGGGAERGSPPQRLLGKRAVRVRLAEAQPRQYFEVLHCPLCEQFRGQVKLREKFLAQQQQQQQQQQQPE
jgi:hypothetical protein